MWTVCRLFCQNQGLHVWLSSVSADGDSVKIATVGLGAPASTSQDSLLIAASCELKKLSEARCGQSLRQHRLALPVLLLDCLVFAAEDQVQWGGQWQGRSRTF